MLQTLQIFMKIFWSYSVTSYCVVTNMFWDGNASFWANMLESKNFLKKAPKSTILSIFRGRRSENPQNTLIVIEPRFSLVAEKIFEMFFQKCSKKNSEKNFEEIFEKIFPENFFSKNFPTFFEKIFKIFFEHFSKTKFREKNFKNLFSKMLVFRRSS